MACDFFIMQLYYDSVHRNELNYAFKSVKSRTFTRTKLMLSKCNCHNYILDYHILELYYKYQTCSIMNIRSIIK